MSANILNEKHIQYLVNAGVRAGLLDPLHMDIVKGMGQKLVNMNYQSINHRYNDHLQPEEYFHQWNRKPVDHMQTIKACHCYEYQSSENQELYLKSDVKKFIENLREDAIRNLPGYDKAKWEIID